MNPATLAIAGAAATVLGVALIVPWAVAAPAATPGARWRMAGFGFALFFPGLFSLLFAATIKAVQS